MASKAARLLRLPVLLAVVAGGTGCLWWPGQSKDGPATQQWAMGGTSGSTSGSPASLDPAAPAPDPYDPKTTTIPGVEIKIYAVVIPRGSVSSNEMFWKRVDENALDPGRYQLLFSNGFRVGVAQQEDWGYFRDLLDRYPVRHQLSGITAVDETRIEVPVRKAVATETLSYFASNGMHEMRTHVECDNVLSFGFVPAPRRRDAARVALTPVVREQKERLSLERDGEEKSLKITVPTRYYDLSLSVEVPFGRFLVISPSTDVALSTSIGRNFLLFDGEAEQSELVLLVVPTPVQGHRVKDIPQPESSPLPAK